MIDGNADLGVEQRCAERLVEACDRSAVVWIAQSRSRSNLPLPKGRQTIAMPLHHAHYMAQVGALTPNLALLPILERRNAPSNIYEGRGVIIRPVIPVRLPGELLAGVSEPLFGVPVDLHPSDHRGMVERLRT